MVTVFLVSREFGNKGFAAAPPPPPPCRLGLFFRPAPRLSESLNFEIHAGTGRLFGTRGQIDFELFLISCTEIFGESCPQMLFHWIPRAVDLHRRKTFWGLERVCEACFGVDSRISPHARGL